MSTDKTALNLTDSSGDSHGLRGNVEVDFTPENPYATITVSLASASDQTNELKAAAGGYDFTVTSQSWTNKVADQTAKDAFDTAHAGDSTAIAAVAVKNGETNKDATSRVRMSDSAGTVYSTSDHAITFSFYVRPNGNLSKTDSGDGVDDQTGLTWTIYASIDGGTSTFVDYVDVTTNFVVSD